MSSDYRPRGAGGSSSSGSNSGGSGGRRRRGGRGRTSHGSSENRVHSNGTTNAAPKKEKTFLEKLLGFFSGKKKAPEPNPLRTPTTSRPDFKSKETREPREPREPRAERPPRDDRPPKAEIPPQEIVSPKLYVGNLAYEAVESDLFDLFSKVGAVKNVEIAMDRNSQRSKGFGFVEMETLETAKEAAAKLNRTDFMSRQIVVSGAKVDKRPSQSARESDSTGSSPDSTI